MFAVLDGHGPLGHLASAATNKQFKNYIEANAIHGSIGLTTLKHMLLTSVLQTAHSLGTSSLDLSLSGTTLSAVLIRGNTLLCANVGDSRVVLGQLCNNEWKYIELTQDHTPSVPEERARIREHKGRIEPVLSETGTPIGPDRVWLPKRNYPGLAMTRSIGDTIAQSLGVISVPDIMSRYLSQKDRFLIVATDGLWSHVSSRVAVRIVANCIEAGQVANCCEVLMNKAKRQWEKRGDYIDDITIIVVLLK